MRAVEGKIQRRVTVVGNDTALWGAAFIKIDYFYGTGTIHVNRMAFTAQRSFRDESGSGLTNHMPGLCASALRGRGFRGEHALITLFLFHVQFFPPLLHASPLGSQITSLGLVGHTNNAPPIVSI